MTMIRKLCLALFLVSGLASAGSSLLSWTPPDTGALIGINIEQIKATKLGQALFSQLNTGNPAIQKWIDQIGFDPRRDIHEIVIMPSTTNPKGRVLFVVRGSFDLARLLAAAKASGTAVSMYRGIPILTTRQNNPMNKQDEPFSLACLNPSLVVGGDPESVRAAIDRRDEPGRLGAALTARAEQLSASNDIWLVGRAPAEPPAAKGSPMPGPFGADLFRSIQQFGGGVKFGPKLLLSADLVTGSESDANAMLASLNALIALASASRKPGSMPALDDLKMYAEGKSIKIALAIPEEQIIKSMQSAITSALQRAKGSFGAPAAAPKPTPPADGGIVIQSSPSDMGTITIQQ